jgi:hypothetical protein
MYDECSGYVRAGAYGGVLKATEDARVNIARMTNEGCEWGGRDAGQETRVRRQDGRGAVGHAMLVEHVIDVLRRPPAAQRRRPRRGVRSQARRHLPLPPRGGRW